MRIVQTGVMAGWGAVGGNRGVEAAQKGRIQEPGIDERMMREEYEKAKAGESSEKETALF